MKNLNKYFSENYSEIEYLQKSIVNVYTSFNEEVKTLKYGVGIHNNTYANIAKLSGKDSCALLQRISTNDLDELKDFHYKNTLFLNEKGGLIDRTTILKYENVCYLVGSYDEIFRLQRWIERYTLNEDIKIENMSGKFLLLQILGLQAESYLTLICGNKIEELGNNQLHEINIEGLKFYLLKKETLKGEKLYWIISDIENSVEILKYMFSHKSVFDLNMIGEKALLNYKIENVIPSFPNEINDFYNPYEAGLQNEISATKKNYIGYDLIHNIKAEKIIRRKLKKVYIQAFKDVILPMEIFDEKNNFIGVITSLIKNEENKFLALCYLENPYFEMEEKLKIKTSNNIKLNMEIKDR